MNALKQLEQFGQSPWLDYVRRSMIERGEIATMIERDGLKGMTSNPAIFQKAIGDSSDYDADLKQFQGTADHGISELYEHMAVADIQAAADALRPVFDRTGRVDGYISLEVSPYLANDTEATITEALRLWKIVDRPNLMVKIPATPAGIPAIRTAIGRGLNVNVTLLFAVDAYDAVHEAYIAGLEDLARSGGDVSHVSSVASFFVSRIDALLDKKLDARVKDGLPAAEADALRSKVAIANAKIAYAHYKRTIAEPRWQALAAKGAKVQRLLWASTGTKNPKLPDTLYVSTLIGRDTVNTLPPATMDAFRDHGTAEADTIESDLPGAEATMQAVERAGVSMQALTAELVEDGVRQFADAFDSLLGTVARRRRTLFEGDKASLAIHPGSDAFKTAYDAEMEAWRKDGRIRRLWQGDAKVWSGADEADWLGWLHIVEQEADKVAELQQFAKEVKSRGFTDVVLLGMGGSSLGPEVVAQTFGHQDGAPRFHMLDSTDPAQVRTVERAVGDLKTALVIVSSKSGSTLEPNIFMAYFLDRVRAAGGSPSQFVAVTDPGSSLEKDAKQLGFGWVFHGLKSIGGRYSVLSRFGLVPAAALGIDLAKFLDRTRQMVRSCADDVPPAENPGVQLGVAMGVAATKFGRDKVTILAAPGLQDLGAWLEQLIAESTGKQGHGLIPVDAEPLTEVARYGKDRFFAHVSLGGATDATTDKLAAALEAAGHPVARIVVADAFHLGAEFFRWEIATAVAGAVIGINPFDQPDVEASKIKTRALTDEVERTGQLPAEQPVFQADGVSVFADAANATVVGKAASLTAVLRAHLGRVGAGDYVALLAYIERNTPHTGALTAMRGRILERTGAATCLGFGPRFLHSTGQAYKGGPNSGVFLQITTDDRDDLPVPGRAYNFGLVKAAQARGDLGVLEERGRRAIRVHLADVEAGLTMLGRAIDEALT